MLSLRGLTIGVLRFRIRGLLIGLLPFSKSNGSAGIEMGFILRTIGNRSTDLSSDLNWERLLEIAYKEGIAGYLYDCIKERDIPDSVLSILKNSYHRIAASNLIRITILEILEEALKEREIEVMALKGASLLESVYTRMGMRPMDDLDLMLRPEDKERFSDLLRHLGFKKAPGSSHFFMKDGVGIDLHIHALNIDRIKRRRWLFPLGMGPVWEDSIPWKDGFRWLRKPDRVDNIFLLSQHFMKHSFSKQIWLIDVLQLLRGSEEEFWVRLNRRSRYLKQERPFIYSLYLLDKLLFYRPPMGSGFEGVVKRLTRMEKGILDIRIRGGSLVPMGTILATCCVQGNIKRAAFLFENLFPRRKIIGREFFRSGPEVIFFYPRRILRLLPIVCKRFFGMLETFIRGHS